jgi:nitroreductase
MSQADTLVSDYDILMDLIRTRTGVRKLKPDPIADDSVRKVLEVGRWAMSGANGQPWDFIVVTDAAIKKEPFRAYAEVNQEFIYWMEEQRDFKLRHPAYQMTHRDTVQRQRTQVGCGRRLPPSSSSRAAGGGNGRPYRAPTRSGGPVASDRSARQCLHADASRRGRARARQPARQYSYRGAIQAHSRPAGPLAPGADQADRLADMVHKERFDMSKYMSNERVIS